MDFDWKKIGVKLAGAALPVLGAAVSGPLGATAGGVLADFLGVENTPEAVSNALDDPKAITALKKAKLESDTQITLAYIASENEKLKIVNNTMRTEANSFDAFVRRWRPFYGYCLAVTWTIQMILTTIYIGNALTNPEINFAAAIAPLVSVYTILAGMWTVALTVLGVSVHSRTKDKQIGNGEKLLSYIKGDN